jgi:hypothetical protein
MSDAAEGKDKEDGTGHAYAESSGVTRRCVT